MNNRRIIIAIAAILGIILAIIAIISLIFDTTVTVSFDSNGGTPVSPQIVVKNNKVIEPATPTGPEGTEFAGWYLNDEKWDFENNIVTEPITLQARWNWDGQNASYDWFKNQDYEKTENFNISNGAELNALALLVRGEADINSTPIDFQGKNIILTQDIYIDGKEWIPIGTETIAFKGNFLGQGNTISGLTITDANENLTGWDAGLFGLVEGTAENSAKIVDLILTNVNIDLKTPQTGYAGSAVATWIKYVDVTNVTASGKINVENNSSTIAGMFLINEEKVTMNNVVNNVEITGDKYGIESSVSAYYIMGGIVGQTTGNGPMYYKNCRNNANIIMNNPFEKDLSKYVGKYMCNTIAGHIVGQTSGSDETRVIFDNCSKADNALIYGAHMYKVEETTNGYNLTFVIPAVMQGNRYTGKDTITEYGYTYIDGDNDKSFVYGNETIYFVPAGTKFNLNTINEDYKTRTTPGFVDEPNCFYRTKVATTPEDINSIAIGKALFSYSSGSHAIVYTK